jgi:hypothetical protein
MPSGRCLPEDPDMIDRRFAFATLLAAVIAGCGGGSGGPGASPVATTTAVSTDPGAPTGTGPDQSLPAGPTASPPGGGIGGGIGGGGTGGGGGIGGGGPNTVVYQWQDRTDRSGNGVSDVITTSYKAIVNVTLTKTDIYAYEIAASAAVSATFTEDYKSSCSHYTDDASGSGTVSGQGGLQAGEIGEAFEFYVDLLGATGTNHTVRDDSPCGGPNYADSPEWPVPPVHVTGGDTIADPHHIAGSASIPRPGGTETVTWDFTLP